MKNKIDLWPIINLDTSGETPLKILLEQAEVLSQKTKGLVIGNVLTNPKGNLIFHTFYLVAPMLNNYRYSLMDVVHSAMPYPTFIYNNNIETDDFVKVKRVRKQSAAHKLIEILEASRSQFELAPESVPEPDVEVHSAEDFIKEIAKIFQSKNTSAVLNSLISQSIQNEQANKLRK